MQGRQLEQLHPCTFVLCRLPVSEPERNVSLKVEQTCLSLKRLQHRPPLIQPAVCEKFLAINVEEVFKRACSHLLSLPAYQEISGNDSIETRISKGAHRYPLFSVTLSLFPIIHICGIIFVLLPKLEAYLFPWL